MRSHIPRWNGFWNATKKPKDPTIAEKFNTYQFAEYKESVIELLQKVCTVSVETMKIIKEMPK
jgi:predicted helicase